MKIEKRNCVVCGKEFEINTVPSAYISKKRLGYNRITCSKRCSKIHIKRKKK